MVNLHNNPYFDDNVDSHLYSFNCFIYIDEKEYIMLVLLDRDGVINMDLSTGVRSTDEFKFIPKSIDAIRLLNSKKIPVAIVTNQALVGRGDISELQLNHIHEHMNQILKSNNAVVDHIFYCTDTTIEPHDRRKPAAGMLLEAMDLFQKHPCETIMIGDALRDLQAAKTAGCRRILVKTGKGLLTLKSDLKALEPFDVFDSLWQAVQHLLPTNE